MIKKFNPSLVKVVNILKDGQYHDGNTIGKKLKMTRSAVWKIIKRLESYDVSIDSIKGKGYAMLESLVLLEPAEIKKNINEKIDITIFEKIDSTNNYLKTIKSTKSMAVCLAEQQTHGKGRLSRVWYSPFAKNVYFSCLYPFQKDISELSGLSLVTSLAILKTLKSFGITDNLFVKWPNDIICGNKKLSGTLIEIQAETHGFSHAIIGIGINVNMMDADDNISQAWTSMQKVLNRYINRNDLCVHLINNLISYLHRFNAYGFSRFADEWMDVDCLTNQTVMLKNMSEEIKGKVTGINEQGHLLLRLASGAVRAFSSGDTSILKKA